jgi:hypothetical protein
MSIRPESIDHELAEDDEHYWASVEIIQKVLMV